MVVFYSDWIAYVRKHFILMRQMIGYLNILLALQVETDFDRTAFAGIAAKAHAHGNALLHLKSRHERFIDAVHRHQIDGLIISSDYEDVVEEASTTGKPCVNIANYPQGHSKASLVGTDDKAIGTLIAEHFLSRGFKHMAAFTDIRRTYFEPRWTAFVNAIREAGYGCPIGPSPLDESGTDNPTPEIHAGNWLRSLPKPLGLMTPFDGYAREAVIACRTVGLRVPQDVSIVGVDNDQMMCMTVWPQLSSVVTQGDRIGHVAMDLLLRLLAGEAKPPEPILVQPSGIIVRGSSSETAVADDEVAQAVNYIRANAGRSLRVDDVVARVAVSRRTLERRFVQSLGRNIADEIRRAHVERARKLLIETDLPLPEVARRSGLIRQQQLSRVIKEETGQTPRKLRATYRIME